MKTQMSRLCFNIKALKIIYISIIVTLLSACSDSKENGPSIYLMPEGYVGSVYIIYNVPNGQPPRYEGESRVYEIPASGMLITQMKMKSGREDNGDALFYFKNGDGTRTLIVEQMSTRIYDTPENREYNKAVIFGGSVGEIEPIRRCSAGYIHFTVGTKAQFLDNINIFDIYDAKGIKNIDKSIFYGMCPDRIMPNPSVYLIPEEYKGTFYIIYNVPKGQPAKYENGSAIFEIPQSGVLLTQASGSPVWDENPPNWHYYYVDNNGSKTPITGTWSSGNSDKPKNINDTKIVKFHTTVGMFEPVKGCDVNLQRFAVGTTAEINSDKYYFGIYDEKGIKNMDKALFEGACSGF